MRSTQVGKVASPATVLGASEEGAASSCFGEPAGSPTSDPHRHQDVKRRLVAPVLNHGRRTGIRELEVSCVALQLRSYVEEITGVEADLQWRSIIVDADLLGCAPALGIVDRQDELVGADVELHRASALARDGGYAVDGALELRIVDLERLVV